MGSTPGNEGGGGAHCGTSALGEAKEGFEATTFFGGDRAPAGGGRPWGSLKHQDDEWEVRGGPIEEGWRRKWSSPEGWTHGGDDGSGFIVPGDGFQEGGGQMPAPCHKEGGGVVCLGWHYVVEGERRRGTRRLPCQSRELRQRRESGGRLGRATWRRRGGGPTARGRRWGPAVQQRSVPTVAGGVGRVAAVRHGTKTGVRGSAQGGRKMVPAEEHSSNFHLFQNFQLPQN
jgi:hypothetical protein